jgi:CO/xanthine dehydrogenase FAD-binding subunit
MRTKEEVFNLIASHKGTRIIAGGTDILVKKKKGKNLELFIDITNIQGLSGISEFRGTIHIGATSTHSQITEDTIIREKALSLSLACNAVGTPQIRNMGTIGGNIANASPAADTIPPLLIHDAVCILESEDGIRREPLATFIVAPYKTSIRENEILTGVDIKELEGYREGYRRVAKRATWAIARMSVAWAIQEDNSVFKDVRLAIGSCTPMPFRPEKAEAFLKDKTKGDETIRVAVNMIIKEIRQISGERPSFVYKIPVLEGLLYTILRG